MSGFKKLISILLTAVLCLSLLPAAMASGEAEEPAPAAEFTADTPEAPAEADETQGEAEPAPAADGIAYYEIESDGQGETEKVEVQSWARPAMRGIYVGEGETGELEVIVDDGCDGLVCEWSRRIGFEGDYTPVEDVSGPVIAVPYTSESFVAYYRCHLTWGNREETIDFNAYFAGGGGVRPRSELNVRLEGAADPYRGNLVQVDAGGSVTLKMIIEDGQGNVLPADGLDCTWSTTYIDENGHWLRETLDNEKGVELTVENVTSTRWYNFEVSNGNDWADTSCRVEVKSDLKIDLRHSAMRVVEYEYFRESDKSYYASYVLNAGDPAALTAIVSGADSNEITGYWQSSDDREEKEGTAAEKIGADGAEWTYEVSTAKTGALIFSVTDPYGNTRNAYVRIRVENHLGVDKINQTGGVTLYEYDLRNGDHTMKLVVDPGAPLKLEAIVKADDTEGVTFEWTDYGNRNEWDGPGPDDGQGAAAGGKDFTLDSADARREVSLLIQDAYGNAVRAHINVCLENGFTAVPEGAAEGRQEVNIPAEVGGTCRLKVNVTAKDDSALTYVWSYFDADGSSCGLYDESGAGYNDGPVGPGWDDDDEEETEESPFRKADELIVEHLPASVTYCCAVSDGYGNEEYVYFHLNIGGNLYGTSGRMDILDANGDNVVDSSDASEYIKSEEVFDAVLTLQQITGI